MIKKVIAIILFKGDTQMTTIQKILISRRMLVADTIPTKAAFKLEGAILTLSFFLISVLL